MASKMEEGLVLSGYHKKLKTMKKKFFVLYKETTNNTARLEYYDTEKKFLQKTEPKRVIFLKNCFNINRRLDTKHKFVLALSSRDGGFGIVLESESDLREWLENLLSLQRRNANVSDQNYPPFEHVWQIVFQKKGIAEKNGIIGSYHCCLSSKSLTFLCIGSEKSATGEERIAKVEILLTTIRRCGHASPQGIFYMELGRQSVFGSGELWMETEDAGIAKNMHDMILSAMSAKSEFNMNIMGNCQAKSEPNNEAPMRKRSSSANEASKPINVIQKRNIPIEMRNSTSPQNSRFGRERCDSLPTRNRTMSECTNHAFRSNTVSGFRPYYCQRHSNSPPSNTPMRCSESEESSISIDETDDNGSLNLYRINARSSKGVIFEENIDEILVSDNRCSQLQENPGILPNYIPMTPIKSTNEIVDANQLNKFTQIVLMEDTGFKNRIDVGNKELNYDFPEHASEHFGKDSDIDIDDQCERPARTYSIGNKIEHNRLGNMNEMEKSSQRVRAFSVGSRSKIPRCDLQRGVLSSKIRREKNINGSNCNISVEGPTYNDIACTSREKKSISAPLLNVKSQINSDRMSDLMEIDFSRVTSSSSPSTHMLRVSQPPKTMRSSIILNNTNFLHHDKIIQCEVPRTISNVEYSSDGGYLEMKPLGNTPSNYNIIKLENQIKPIKSENKADTQIFTPPECEKDTRLCSNKIDMMNQNSTVMSANLRPAQGPTASVELDGINNTIKANINKPNLKLGPNLQSDEYISIENKNLENKMHNLVLDMGSVKNKSYYTDERKLTHSISNEDYSQNLNRLVRESPDTLVSGYKILQIKSDSSLLTKKHQRTCRKDKFDRHSKIKVPENGSIVDHKVNLIDPPSICNLITPEFISTRNLKSTSRPQSLTSEQELYYASLDLPQSSVQHSIKNPKEVTCESPLVTTSPLLINSYAQIDFDHSDSSSSSTKAYNT